MDIVLLSPLRAASLRWRSPAGAWTLTIICKATYRLAPGVSPLHEEQEDPSEDDAHWDDDPNRSLSSASDLVPFKARPEVLLVGQAFAPKKLPVRSLIARMTVGEVDKAIEVFGERRWGPDGQILEPSTFTSMALAYELAAGGPDTWNPVGVRLDAPPDSNGIAAIPSLQPAGMTLLRRGDFVPPIGFGPIAPAWLLRADRLGRHRGSFHAAAWQEQALPEDLDPAYFNAAPEDQHVEEIHADERILLENLDAEQPRLVTRLPGVLPKVLVEEAGEPARDVAVCCDTLSIDTLRGVCTMVWRGHVQLSEREQRLRVLVSMAEQVPRVSGRNGERNDITPRDGHGAADPSATPQVVADATITLPVSSVKARRQATPFQESDVDRTEDRAGTAQSKAALPGRVVPASDVPPRPSIIIPPPPPVAPQPIVANIDVADEASPANRGSRIGTWRSPGSEAPVVSRENPSGKQPASFGVLEASNAAADPGMRKDVRDARLVVTEAPPRARSSDAIELLWFEAKTLPRMRKSATWKRLLSELRESKPRPRDEDGDDESRDRKQEARDRRDMTMILRGGEALDAAGIDAAFAGAMTEEVFTPPLVLVDGELELPFDEMEILKAVLVVVAPFVPGDKKLKETLEVVAEVMKTPGIERARGVAEALTARVKDAFGRVARSVPTGYLDVQTEPMLLEGRCYQNRAVMGGSYLRGMLSLPGPRGEGPIPLYLPEGLKNDLPMFRRFRVRVVAEVRARVDQQETAEWALKAAAVGRQMSR